MITSDAEFNDVLMVIRRGSTPITLTILGVLHGLVISLSLAGMIALLLKKKQVILPTIFLKGMNV